tara:strand:+ start:1763 stop:2671 length:909 start_codon:yes stop_codon:yes gene_type:complete
MKHLTENITNYGEIFNARVKGAWNPMHSFKEEHKKTTNYIIDKLSTLDDDYIYKFYKFHYEKLRDLQQWLFHNGYQVLLLRGRLLNAYRDFGYHVDIANRPYTTAFGVVNNNKSLDSLIPLIDKWKNFNGIESADYNNWIRLEKGTPISNIPKFWGSAGYRDKNGNYVGGSSSLSDEKWLQEKLPDEDSTILMYNFAYPEFVDFMFFQIEFVNWLDSETMDESIVGHYYDSHNGTTGGIYPYKWVINKSRVWLYGQPFVTLDSDCIEDYLECTYGEGWNVPVGINDYFKERDWQYSSEVKII